MEERFKEPGFKKARNLSFNHIFSLNQYSDSIEISFLLPHQTSARKTLIVPALILF